MNYVERNMKTVERYEVCRINIVDLIWYLVLYTFISDTFLIYLPSTILL